MLDGIYNGPQENEIVWPQSTHRPNIYLSFVYNFGDFSPLQFPLHLDFPIRQKGTPLENMKLAVNFINNS